jgi:hypothetical protein
MTGKRPQGFFRAGYSFSYNNPNQRGNIVVTMHCQGTLAMPVKEGGRIQKK